MIRVQQNKTGMVFLILHYISVRDQERDGIRSALFYSYIPDVIHS